jgi:hypothetical protein
MRKMLASLALFLAILPMQTRAQTEKTQKPSKGDNPAAPVTSVAQKQVASPSLQPIHQEHVQNDVWVIHAPDKDGWDKASFAVSVLLLGVGIFGVFYAKRTLDKLEHHATQFEKLAKSADDNAAAAKDTAAAAKLHAQAIINTGRAWIVEEIDFPIGPLPHIREGVVQNAHILYVAFELRNGGKSAAKVTDFRLRFHGVRSISDLPTEPFYGHNPPMQELGSDGLVMVPSGATKVPTKTGIPLEGTGCLSRQEFLDIEQGRAGLVVYGKIEYQSLGEPHVNQFCYVWHKGGNTSNDPPRFRIGGPYRYNYHT